MKDIIIFSDIHLNSKNKRKTETFIKFLESDIIESNKRIIILGDFLDFWFENEKYDLSNEYTFLNRIKEIIKKKEVEVDFIKGNRDFLAGERFENITGFKIIGDEYLFENNNKKYLMLHGDIFCTRDKSYFLWRFLSRSVIVRKFTNFIPKKLILTLVKSARSMSYVENLRKSYNINNIVLKEVIKRFLEFGYDYIICGHTHRMIEHPIEIGNETKLFFITARWTDQGGYYIYLKENAEEPEIKYFYNPF